jgi:hypothetical protein
MATTTKKSAKPKAKTPKAKTTTKRVQQAKGKVASRTSAARTTSTKTTKKIVKKPVEKTVEIKSLRSFRRDKDAPNTWRVATFERLRSLHLVSVGVFALLAIAAGFLMNDSMASLTIGHLTRDVVQSTDQTVFTQAVYNLYDIELRWVVVALMATSAVLPLLYLTRLKGQYQSFVEKTRLAPYRWIEAGLIGALMTETVAVLYGVTDVITLKLIAGLALIAALFGMIAERQNDKATQPVKSAYQAGVFAGILPLLAIGASGLATYMYGLVRSPWYVYAAYAVLVVSFALASLSQWKFISRSSKVNTTLAAERNYVALSLLTRVVFAVVLIVGLRAV